MCEVALWLAGSLLYVKKLNHSDVLTPPYFICAWAVTMMTCVHISYVSESRGCAPGSWVDLLGDLTRSYLRGVCNTYHEYLEAHCDITQVRTVAVCALRFG